MEPGRDLDLASHEFDTPTRAFTNRQRSLDRIAEVEAIASCAPLFLGIARVHYSFSLTGQNTGIISLDPNVIGKLGRYNALSRQFSSPDIFLYLRSINLPKQGTHRNIFLIRWLSILLDIDSASSIESQKPTLNSSNPMVLVGQYIRYMIELYALSYSSSSGHFIHNPRCIDWAGWDCVWSDLSKAFDEDLFDPSPLSERIYDRTSQLLDRLRTGGFHWQFIYILCNRRWLPHHHTKQMPLGCLRGGQRRHCVAAYLHCRLPLGSYNPEARKEKQCQRMYWTADRSPTCLEKSGLGIEAAIKGSLEFVRSYDDGNLNQHSYVWEQAYVLFHTAKSRTLSGHYGRMRLTFGLRSAAFWLCAPRLLLLTCMHESINQSIG